jgi:Zn-dependent M28 family amino/carboxypeptidase
VSGDSKGERQDMLAADAAKQGRYFTPEAKPQAGHFFRSDHFSFFKRGVPALSVSRDATSMSAGSRWARPRPTLSSSR